MFKANWKKWSLKLLFTGAVALSEVPGVGTLGGALLGGTYGVLAGSMDCAADRNL